MNSPEEQYWRSKKTLTWRWRRFLRLRPWKWWSVKVPLNVDRRLLAIVMAVAMIGAVHLYRTFHGLEVFPMADTSSNRWPEAGGRLVIRSWDWWGIKRAEYLAETRWVYLEDRREKRWMIIKSTGGNKSGWTDLPRPLFFDDNDPDDSGTAFNISSKERLWFNFRKVDESDPELK